MGIEVQRTLLRGELSVVCATKPGRIRRDLAGCAPPGVNAFDQDFCRASGLALSEEGTIVIDRFTHETSRKNFFAGGDVITGASNVSNAMAGGKQAARKIDERLMGAARWEEIFPKYVYEKQVPGEPSLSHRHAGHSLPPPVRSRSQEEVVVGLSVKEALEECRRCLRCDVRTNGNGE